MNTLALLVSLLVSLFPQPVYSIENDIIVQSYLNGIDPVVSLEIATCESQLGKYPVNWEGSSASGVYMFTSGTWNAYCKGDVMNPHDNIRCFMQQFNQHPNWWACYDS